MGFRFKRRRDSGESPLQGEAAAVAQVLDQAAARYGSDPRDFDLAVALGDLMERAPTADARALVEDGVDEDELYERELRPNWEGLTQAERRAKVEAFARFANALGDDAERMGALVRTKLLVLAWAYDRTYGEGFLFRLEHEPERFGRLALFAAY
jgi:hypothetical protein